MLVKILSRFGLPFLIKLVNSGLEKLTDASAKKASQALGEVSSAINEQKISSADLSEANRHMEKMQELENELDKQTLSEIHQTIRQELNAEDKFVRFWRPAFGYSVALAWLLTIGTVCYVVLAGYPNAENIIAALVETTSLWSVALGVLGLQVVKTSQEKQNRPKEGMISKLINKIT